LFSLLSLLISSFSFSFNLSYCHLSNQLASVTSDHNILFYDIGKNFKRTKQIVGYNDEVIDSLFCGKNDEFLVTATNSEQVKLNGQNNRKSVSLKKKKDY